MINTEKLVLNPRDRVYEYDTLRIILTAMVVVGHLTFYNSPAHRGGIYYRDLMFQLDISDALFHVLATYVTTCIYTFHMPAFFFLSGMIFGLELKRGKHKVFLILVKTKCKRLIIPFVFVFFAYTVPVKFLSGYYKCGTTQLGDILLQIVNPYRMHLWYLEALFFCFCITFFLHSLRLPGIIKFIVILGINLIGCYIEGLEVQLLGNPFLYLMWFEYGILYNEWWDTHKVIFRKRAYIVSVLIIYLAFLFVRLKISSNYLVTNILLPILGIELSWIFSTIITGVIAKYSVLETLSSYCFGIYLYSEPVNYIVLNMFYKRFGIQFFGTELGAAAIYFSRLLLSLLISIGITWTLKKSKFPVKAY